jgi:phosphonate transport system substrate-binding protein
VRRALSVIVLALVAALTAACGGGGEPPRELVISAIPDQDPAKLQRLYGALSERLSTTLGIPVRYVPLTDYAASVTAYRRGDLDMVFFGGLTGVQAREQVEGSVPLAQRNIDERFRSVFIATPSSGIGPIADVAGLQALAGRSVTFGSESSTSGRLMPQYFLGQAGVGPDAFRGPAGFSGSHDATIAVVSSGAYEVGALNSSVWDKRVREGSVDPSRAVEIFRTPTYHDYHWLARPDIDEQLGEGMTARIGDALLGLDPAVPEDKAILDLFEAGSFIPTRPENYDRIEEIGRSLGLVQ